jgi:undecaprenyl-diphosphatase
VNFLAACISRLGDGWLYVATALYLILAVHPLPTPALLTMALAVCFSMGLALGTKPLVARPRPEPTPSTRLLAIDRHSFPSGHTFTAFAFAVSCGWFYPYALAGLIPYAFLMGWARVRSRAHYPSDVVVAAVWGCLVGWGSVAFVKWVEAA